LYFSILSPEKSFFAAERPGSVGAGFFGDPLQPVGWAL